MLPAFALSLAGCGLDFPLILASPAQGSLSTDSLFPFFATGENIELELKGFEVYYKIYVPPGTDAEKYFASQYELAAAGFRKLTRAADSSASPQIPLLPIDAGDKGTTFEVTVDFTIPDIADAPTIYDDGTPVVPLAVAEVRRSIVRVTPPTEFKPFNEWDSTDADISPTIYNDYIKNVPFPNALLLRLFVVSFGLDATGAIYSLPVWIGDGNITFQDGN